MPEHETRKTPTGWMRNLLLASAALNVFLAGFLFAKFLGPAEEPQNLPQPSVSLGPLPPDLSPELREKFENNFEYHQEEVEKKYRDLFRTRLKIRDLMELSDLDEEALNEALEEMRGLQFEIQGTIHETMVDTLRELDPEKRRIFILGGDDKLERGIWTQRRFDGSRWRVEFENGEIIIDFEGFTRDRENDNEKPRGE